MGGCAFAMYRFPGRNWLFGLMLATMMIPWMAGIVPWFILISKWLHWINRYEALVFPGATSVWHFLDAPVYPGVDPHELLDAAHRRLSRILDLFRIVAPLLMPAFAALGIMIFIGSWNGFSAPCW